jgi:cytochrome c553
MHMAFRRARVPRVLACALAALWATTALAQDALVSEGRRKAAACQACHGMDGMSRLPDAPHIAAHPAPYIERALRAYRSGERRNEVMSIAVKALSDEDIRALAAYYAAVRIEVMAVPQ